MKGLIGALVLSGLLLPAQEQDARQTAVNRANAFLSTQARGKAVLVFMHFGADYVGTEYLRGEWENDGRLTLVYEIKWKTTEPNYTDVAFHCNSEGYVQSTEIIRTSGTFNQPFMWASFSIRMLGDAIISSYKDKLSDSDRKLLTKIVDNADAKTLMELSLWFAQHSNK